MSKSVREMGVWGEGGWQWVWNWRRPLFYRERNILTNLLAAIDNFKPSQGVSDSWRWRHSRDGRFITKEAYEVASRTLGDDRRPNGDLLGFKLIWKSHAPKKVAAHVWRLLWDRLSTKVNLSKRGALNNSDNTSCCLCGINEESASHCFFTCDFAYTLWMRCFGWWGISTVIHADPFVNLLAQQRVLTGKRGKRVAITIWMGITWII